MRLSNNSLALDPNRGSAANHAVLHRASPVGVDASVDPLSITCAEASTRPLTTTDDDGATIEVFSLPTDEASLFELLSDLFEHHWREITFGPFIQGAAWEMKVAEPPSTVAMFDGYLTVAFGVPHFHLCIGSHKGPRQHPVSPALGHHRRTARAELYRRLSGGGTPVTWGLRLFNGKGEQQINVFLPNPFLHPETDRLLRVPDWSRLNLWDELRAHWCHLHDPDPFDRSGKRFSHY